MIDLALMTDTSPEFLLRFVVTTHLTDSDVADHATVLNVEEALRVSRLVFAEDRRDYTLAHALLRRTLTEVIPGIAPVEWCFERTALGKPFLSSAYAEVSQIRFSISHTRGMVACIVSRCKEVGIDVECSSRPVDVQRLMRDVCSHDEQKQIELTAPSDRAQLFLDLWILKEAYLKATGLGMTIPLRHLSFDLRTSGVILATIANDMVERWWFGLIGRGAEGRIGVAIATSSRQAPTLSVAAYPQHGSLLLEKRPIDIYASSPPSV
jgi:4'-phosphopantetheinyl transferase